jgi:hypothetical protein
VYDEFFKAYKHVHEVSTSKRSEGIAINTEDLKKITLSRAKIVYLTHLVALSLNTLNSFTNKTNKEQVKKH